MQADKLRELLAKYPAPWKADEAYTDGGGRYVSVESSAHCVFEDVAGQHAMDTDAAALVVAMRNKFDELLAIAEGAEADRADAIGELQSVEHSMKAGGQTLVTYRVLDTNYHAPMHVRIVSLDAALAGAVTQGEGS